MHMKFMPFFSAMINVIVIGMLASCSVNPATGERQFTAFLPEAQEARIGAENHQAILAEYGYYDDPAIQSYVNQIGQKLVQGTERDGVNYTFTVVDSPVVNAFAVPGGYIYITRGLMALANDEAELASVIGHEIAHITARHSAQQQSRSALASLGLTALSIATDLPASAGQAAGLGADLYLKSYSRSHENQADELGIRYLTRAGYSPFAAPEFLTQLERDSQLAQMAEGQGTKLPHFFSTHPITSERINNTIQLASGYAAQNGADNKVEYFSRIDGMVYGASPRDGYIRGQNFIHTELGFKFSFPQGYAVENGKAAVIGEKDGLAFIFDGGKKERGQSLENYLIGNWLKGKSGYEPVQAVTISGMPGVTTSLPAQANGRPVTARLYAVAYSDTRIYRFTLLYPQEQNASALNALRDMVFSFKRLSASDKSRYRPYRIKVFAARVGDSVAARAAQLPFEDYKIERFRVLNGLDAGQELVPNRLYKGIIE